MSKYTRRRSRALHTDTKVWRAIRAQVLTEQPLCLICQMQGKIEPAVHVDHIDNDAHNNERSNLQGLCARHHSEKTAAEMRGKIWRVKGCDANGFPHDPGHHWNQ